MTRTSHRAIAAAIVVLAATPASGCHNDRQPTNASPTAAAPAPTSPSTAPSAVPDTPQTAQQRAIEAYLGMQRAYLKAGETADPAYPDLATYTTGAARQRLTGYLKCLGDPVQPRLDRRVAHPEDPLLSLMEP